MEYMQSKSLPKNLCIFLSEVNFNSRKYGFISMGNRMSPKMETFVYFLINCYSSETVLDIDSI